MQEVSERIDRVATSHASVLITGETGTGKELIAWAIHEQSPRASKPLVVVNCGAIPPSLADAELFGHERGAFTGDRCRQAREIRLADAGTLFLDEISAMPLDLSPAFSESWKTAGLAGLGHQNPLRWTFESLRRPTSTLSLWSGRERSGRTSITGSMSFLSSFRPFESGRTTSRFWPVHSSPSSLRIE